MTEQQNIAAQAAQPMTLPPAGTQQEKKTINVLKAEFATRISDPWTRMNPIMLGQVPQIQPDQPVPAPNLYVTVAAGPIPVMIAGLYADPKNVYGFEEARIWNGHLAIGFGRFAYMVSLKTRLTAEYDLESDFCQFFPLQGFLLIASMKGLGMISDTGEVLWDRNDLAEQGVLVTRVADQAIGGRCQFKDGWKDIRLDVFTGKAID
ncbi:MAG: hypothetical protein ACLFUJ_13040 [Phycisphaerae bacterium]